jgi:O-succinylbenzoic acid--CoA ligase
VFLGRTPVVSTEALDDSRSHIMIATGGTSGVPRWAVHTWESLHTAAAGLQAALGGGPIHSVCCLPLSHVSGLMQVIRSFVSGGRLSLVDGRALAAGNFPVVREGAVISLVPTQLARLLDVAGGAAWLRRFRAVFLGGGPAWPELLTRAREERVPLAPCFGMTETAAQVTMLKPAEFLAGRDDAGRALPHARVEVVDDVTGAVLAPGMPGRIRVRGRSLFRGFLPQPVAPANGFLTADRGMLDAAGHLTVLGRSDSVIITGGEKVDPATVEAAIRSTGIVDDVAVLGVPDPEWGEAVVAVVVLATPASGTRLTAAARERLAPACRPKRWVMVAALPRNDAGKLDRRALLDLAGGTG